MIQEQVKQKRVKRLIALVMSLFAYAFILKVMTWLFRSFQIRNFGYCILATLIIYGLNITVKPVLFQITVAFDGISFGLFYFVLNCFCVKTYRLDFRTGVYGCKYLGCFLHCNFNYRSVFMSFKV